MILILTFGSKARALSAALSQPTSCSTTFLALNAAAAHRTATTLTATVPMACAFVMSCMRAQSARGIAVSHQNALDRTVAMTPSLGRLTPSATATAFA